MGTDIHANLIRRKIGDGEWEAVWDEDFIDVQCRIHKIDYGHPLFGRNYSLFYFLSGVRYPTSERKVSQGKANGWGDVSLKYDIWKDDDYHSYTRINARVFLMRLAKQLKLLKIVDKKYLDQKKMFLIDLEDGYEYDLLLAYDS